MLHGRCQNFALNGISAGQIRGLACPVVMNAVVQVKGEPDKVVCWFVLQNDISSVTSAVQEQSDTWQLLEPAF